MVAEGVFVAIEGGVGTYIDGSKSDGVVMVFVILQLWLRLWFCSHCSVDVYGYGYVMVIIVNVLC